MSELFNISHLISYYSIGKHIEKSKTLLQTVKNMYPNIPYQIFIGGNINSRLNIDETDIELAGKYVRENNIKLYIHAPYLINLATKTEDNWQISYMCKTMEYGARLGASGVVVHVGKSVKLDFQTAYDQMSSSIYSILEKTSPNCPLLIETPAGQGTEMFCVKEDYLDFINKFVPKDINEATKIGACVDTCHVFACGYKPSEYVKYIGNSGILKLVHYNDSNEICGSCKDRHAFIGHGHIGLPDLSDVAEYCANKNISMVIE
jgi:deoxyribonuclease-4